MNVYRNGFLLQKLHTKVMIAYIFMRRKFTTNTQWLTKKILAPKYKLMTLTPLLPFWMTCGVPLLWGAAWWPLMTLVDGHGVLVGRRVVHPQADPEGSFPWGTTFLSPILSLHLRFLKGIRDLWRLLILSQGCKLEIRYNNKFHLLWNEISYLAIS